MSSIKKQKPVSIREQVLIQKVQNCAEFSAHRWIFSFRNYETSPPTHTFDSWHRLLTALIYVHFMVVGNRMCVMGV
jgi:hypothetical protein